MKYGVTTGFAALLLWGCQTMQAESDVPAIIVSPDAASRAALQATVNSLFADQDVLLADDALAASSVLAIEFGSRGSLDKPPATGRVMDKPLQLRLVKSGDDCVLIDPRDSSRHVLADTTCTPE